MQSNNLNSALFRDDLGGGNYGVDNKYGVNLTYDKVGNIETLSRRGVDDICTDVPAPPVYEFTQIDNLSYSYNDNYQLESVKETSNQIRGFKGAGGTIYGYDDNGNITDDPNKQLSASYNHLNLPYQITLDNNNKINFTYDAGGIKVKKEGNEQDENGYNVDYTKYYISGIEYKNNALEAIYHQEGRAILLAPENETPSFLHEYYLKDHLGNVRVVFSDLNENGYLEPFAFNPDLPVPGGDPENELLQENHYYPFGMEMEGPWEQTVSTPTNSYLYNGKELESDFGLDWLAYGARNYDPAIGRFPSIDRFAEKYYPLTPYQYGANNPISNIDVNGDSLQVFFRGEEARNAFIQVMNNSLEGQFEVYISDNGIVTFGATESGGDVSKMSEHGKAFYEENNKVLSGKGWSTMDIDYATTEAVTGDFDTGVMDMADVLQFNSDPSELGGTQAGKVTHEIVEQYYRQVLGDKKWNQAHWPAVIAENNVNQSSRHDPDNKQKVDRAVQNYTRNGKTVTTTVQHKGGTWKSRLRIIKVTNTTNE